MKQITPRLALWLFAIILSSQAFASSAESALATLSQADSTEKALRSALREAANLAPAERFVIENQLRLRLAATEMQQEDFEEARSTLKQIETESPAALQASLLMAESYRLTDESGQALNWFLRTAQHYPYRTTTLNGLLSAAHDEQSRNTNLSAALYAEISKQSLFALGQLDRFKQHDDLDPMAVIFPSDLDEAVRKTLLRRSLRHPEHNLLKQTGKLKQSVSAIISLQQRHELVQQELRQLTQTLAQYQSQQQALTKQLQTGDQTLAMLTAKLIPNDFSTEQTQIRQHITRLRNQQARQRAQLAFIEHSQQTLPEIANNLEKQLQTLHQNAQKQLASSHTAVISVLEDSIAAYRAELSDLAAEAQLQRSELMLSSQ